MPKGLSALEVENTFRMSGRRTGQRLSPTAGLWSCPSRGSRGLGPVVAVLWVTLVSLLAEEKVDGRPHLSASRLLERRKEFNRNLVNIVKQHHKVRCPHPLVLGCGVALVAVERSGRSGLASRLKDVAGSCGMLSAGRCGWGGWQLESLLALNFLQASCHTLPNRARSTGVVASSPVPSPQVP